MAIFSDIADQWQLSDGMLSSLEQRAFAANNDADFDKAVEQRNRNDQAYFLYLFTRFEDAVNKAAAQIVANRVTGAIWSERRIWEAWSKNDIEDVAFMSKVQVLLDKSRADYATVKEYYEGRNEVAHGGTWAKQFFIPTIAQMMEAISANFPTR